MQLRNSLCKTLNGCNGFEIGEGKYCKQYFPSLVNATETTIHSIHFFHLFTLPSLSLESEKSDSLQSDDKVMAKRVIDAD
jgi:hypothetical protein